MSSSDAGLPHRVMRLRAQGSLCVIQPYSGNKPVGGALTWDLSTGHGKLDEPFPLDDNYIAVYAILGVLRLKQGVAVAVVTAAAEAARVAGAVVYAVTRSRVITTDGAVPADRDDASAVKLLKLAADPNAVGRGLYFSLDANVTLSQQRLHGTVTTGPLWKRSFSEFFWNETLSRPLMDLGADAFIVPFILGFVAQIRSTDVTAGSRTETVTVTLLARRSTRRAGTRHWRRGVDLEGFVANFVESEQVVETSSGSVSAFVQLRGSIPLCWSQVPNSKYKPKTDIADCEHVSLEPFRRHSARTVELNGRVVGVNLANQHGTEGRLGSDYRKLTNLVEKEMDIALVAFDFHKECGTSKYHNLEKLWQALSSDIAAMGVFEASNGTLVRKQTGVIRTNCVDCLDRTNVVQGMLARKALTTFLRQRGLLTRDEELTRFSQLETPFKLLWADHGDMISRQYAGTGALKSGFTRTGKRTVAGLIDDGLKSCVRYYLNNFEDGVKQDALDLITGGYDISQVANARRQACGAVPVLLSALLLLVALQFAVSLPFSKRVTLVYHVLPPAALAATLFGSVLALGRSATCRPTVRPWAAQPWVNPKEPAVPAL